MRYFVTAILLLFLPLFSLAKTTPMDEFRSGLDLYKNGDYQAALNKFTATRKDLSLIDDYVLLYMAQASLGLGDSDASLAAARELVQKYPGSVLVPEAQAVELKNLLNGDVDKLIDRLPKYINHYPAEKDMQLFYGKLLMQQGRQDEALAVLKPLYIQAGNFESDAFEALQGVELSDEELLERAANLMSARRYDEAEKILQPLYEEDKGLKKRAAEKLAVSLFRQRRYAEASKYFLEVDDRYNAARSYIRAGKMNEFYLTLDKMITNRDAQGGVLLVAFANDTRRDGNLEDALSLLDEALANFPLVREDALWNKGWALYTAGRYEEALPIFDELASTYSSNKYQYWKARTQEHMGNDSKDQLAEIKGNDFYAFLASTRTGTYTMPAQPTVESKPSEMPMKRIDLLIQAGLNGYACKELAQLTSMATRTDEYLDIARKFIEIKEYRSAISVMTQLPEQSRPLTILYPAAFWPLIQNSSSQYELDPYLVLSLIREESHFDPQAVSPVGAIGLMQLMPETAKRAADKLDLPIDDNKSIHQVENNIALGTYYFSGLMDEFKSVPAALAAYNAGRTRVREWLDTGQYGSTDEFIEDIPFTETRNYVKRIVTSYFYYQMAYGDGPEKAARIL